MYNLILYCKSYKGDVQILKKLKSSIEKYNKDNIPFYISCPKEDKQLFEDTLGTENYTLLLDEDIYPLAQPKDDTIWGGVTIQTNTNGASVEYPLDGWRSQQIVKSSIHKLKITKNYLCLDSDSYFIKDFYERDFIAKEDICYTLFHENKETQQYKKLFYNTNYSESGYAECLSIYREVFGSEHRKIYDYGPSPYIWSCKVWEHFEKNYLEPNNFTFETFQKTIEQQYNTQMREAITYGEYAINSKVIEIYPTGPLFKVYHWDEMVEFERKVGMFDEEKLKESFLGIVYQSKNTIKL